MFRSMYGSSNFITYVPGLSTMPGISTGCLNVTSVRLYTGSAFVAGAINAQARPHNASREKLERFMEASTRRDVSQDVTIHPVDTVFGSTARAGLPRKP